MLIVRSKSSPLLTDLYNRWFGPPSGPRRKVPKGLQLTPLTLAHWFESDGSTALEQGNLVRLVIRPCQFGREGNLKLQKLLESIGIKARLRRSYDKRYNTECWYLVINDASTVNRFLDMVEPHIHPRYSDKVKRPWLKVLTVGGKRVRGKFVWRGGGLGVGGEGRGVTHYLLCQMLCSSLFLLLWMVCLISVLFEGARSL